MSLVNTTGGFSPPFNTTNAAEYAADDTRPSVLADVIVDEYNEARRFRFCVKRDVRLAEAGAALWWRMRAHNPARRRCVRLS